MPIMSKRMKLPAAIGALAVILSLQTACATTSDDWMDEQPQAQASEKTAAAEKTADTDHGWMEDDASSRSGDASDCRGNGGRSSTPLLQGHATYCVPKGTPIKLKLATVPNFGMDMLQRDLDGKLVPAQVHEEISAKTTEDIFVDDNKAIPAGTIFHGYVHRVMAPGRVGQKGWVQLSFDAFQTPDGRRFAFQAEADNRGHSTTKSKLKRFGYVASYAAGGAVVGALVAYQICGLQETIAMHGYNIAGGAAAGALGGTAFALLRHGPDAVLEPGDDLSMEIDTDMLIPAATKPTVTPPPANVPGLTLKVLKSKVISDQLDGRQLQLKVVIDNNTNKRLESIDLFVEDDNGARHTLVTDPEEDKSEMLFTIDPFTHHEMRLDFALEYPKLKRKIVWLDHNSRQPILEQRLP